jgi:uncharacterized protein DUF6815
MIGAEHGRVALLFRGDRAHQDGGAARSGRLGPVFRALEDEGIGTVPCVFSEDALDDMRGDLLGVDGVLVWVDPVTGSTDRSALDDVLREVARNGAWVSAHPDVVLRMGTKEVLYDTRQLGWGSEVDVYRSFDEFVERFPARLLSRNGARVLKQHRGNGGIGVWKVESVEHTGSTREALVRIQGARHRGDTTEDLTLGEFMTRCEPYFRYSGGEGRLVDQPFQPRIAEGLVRCYLVQREVVGFCGQYPAENVAPDRVLGLPAAKTMFTIDDPQFARLRSRMETEWLPQLQAQLALDDASLPLLWDADFIYGPPTEDGADSYVLCEINVSAVTPFPELAPVKIARAARAKIGLRTR